MSLSPKHAQQSSPMPKHPYRTTAILHGVLALVIVAVTLLTDGDVVQGLLIALAYFVAATGWAWWRFRERIEAEKRVAATRASSNDQ